MTVYVEQISSLTQVGFDHDGGGLRITQGVGLLDFSEMDWSLTGDWSRDTIEWQLDPGTANWTKSLGVGFLVFPLTFDVGTAGGAPTDIGWGIDDFWIDPQSIQNRTNRFDARAKLVLKTNAVEMLRIGFQLTVTA